MFLYLGLIDMDVFASGSLTPSVSKYFWELLTRAHALSQPSRLWEPGAGRGRKGSAAPLWFKEGTFRPTKATKVVL